MILIADMGKNPKILTAAPTFNIYATGYLLETGLAYPY